MGTLAAFNEQFKVYRDFDGMDWIVVNRETGSKHWHSVYQHNVNDSLLSVLEKYGNNFTLTGKGL